MADVKVPPMLHKMSASAQKAWYKKNKMEYPGASGAEGKSAAQAKKDVGEINKKKAREAAIAAAAKVSKKNKELVSSSERVREMGRRRRESGEGLGYDLTSNRGILSYVRSGGYLKAGRLGEEAEQVNEAKPENKSKKKKYVRQVGLEAMKKGEVDPARGHSPQRFGREILKGAAADRAIRKAMEKEMTKMGEDVELAEGKMKDIVTDREETARLAAREKDLPFTPDKKKVRRGPGGPMSQAKWLAKQAMLKSMKKEEVEQTDESRIAGVLGAIADVDKRREAAKKPVNPKDLVVPLSDVPAKKPRGHKTVGAMMKKDFPGYFKESEQVFEQNDTMEKVEMAQGQLHFICYAAEEILEFIKKGGDVEEWYQNKLSKVHSDMESLHSYVEGEMRRTGMKEEKSHEVKEALDPVGKEDEDINNDGKTNNTDVYLSKKRAAVGKAIKDRLAKKLGK
jgi:hypothetical protein